MKEISIARYQAEWREKNDFNYRRKHGLLKLNLNFDVKGLKTFEKALQEMASFAKFFRNLQPLQIHYFANSPVIIDLLKKDEEIAIEGIQKELKKSKAYTFHQVVTEARFEGQEHKFAIIDEAVSRKVRSLKQFKESEISNVHSIMNKLDPPNKRAKDRPERKGWKDPFRKKKGNRPF